MYAVVKIGGSQYKITEGQELEVDKLDKTIGETFEINEVLLIIDGEKVEIGQPYLSGIKIKAKILEHFKGKKIRIARFKAKVRYRRVKGFRPLLTKIKIEEINAEKDSSSLQAKRSNLKSKSSRPIKSASQ